MERSARNLEIVRQTAEILASGSELSETFERFCLMLARFIDASVVYIAVKHPDGISIDFAYDHGEASHPHRLVDPQSQTRRVVETGEAIFIGSVEELDGPVIPLKGAEDSQSAIFVPLRVGPDPIGVLSAQTARRNAYSREDLYLLATCALYVSVAVAADAVRSEKEQLASMASCDALTGVANRRAFDQRLRDDWMRAQRESGWISVLLLDVDWFKRFNDAYGHVAGDACLRHVAQAAQSCVTRESDLFARYGGEEFAAVLWATDASGAATVAERMLNAVRTLDAPHAESPYGRVTVSVGVASVKAAGINDPRAIVKAADAALYAAKVAGRDCLRLDALGDAGALARSVRSNVHALPRALVGRVTEIVALGDLLRSARIVSVVGEPGVGKTRLAVAVAQRRMHAYPDGVWLVDCSVVSEARSLDAFVLGIAGIGQGIGETPRQALLRGLAEKRMMVVFHGCDAMREQVRALCDDIAESATRVTMLVATARPLGAREEQIFLLQHPSPKDAVELFVERARVFGRYALAQDAYPGVRAICQTLSYAPLSIELVAARAGRFGLDALLAAIEPLHDLDAVIDWSLSLSSDAAAWLFARLAVFPSTFSGDEARDVGAGGDLEPWDAADALEELARAGLVRQIDAIDGTQYVLDDPLRSRARTLLRDRGEEEAVMGRFVRSLRALVVRLAQAAENGNSEQMLEQLEPQRENLHAALAYALERGAAPVTGTEMVVALGRYWTEAGHLAEADRWIRAALQTECATGTMKSELLFAAAMVAHCAGEIPRLERLGNELVAYHECSGDRRALARSLTALANAHLHLERFESARASYVRALEAYEGTNDRRGLATALMNVAAIESEFGGDLQRCRELAQRSLALFRELGASTNMGAVLWNLAKYALRLGELGEALTYAHDSLVVFEHLGNQARVAMHFALVGQIRMAEGQMGLARDALSTAFDRLHAEGAIAYARYNLFQTAAVYAHLANRADLSARIYGLLERLRRELSMPQTPADAAEDERTVRELRANLGDAFDSLYERGRSEEPAFVQSEFEELLRAPVDLRQGAAGPA